MDFRQPLDFPIWKPRQKSRWNLPELLSNVHPPCSRMNHINIYKLPSVSCSPLSSSFFIYLLRSDSWCAVDHMRYLVFFQWERRMGTLGTCENRPQVAPMSHDVSVTWVMGCHGPHVGTAWHSLAQPGSGKITFWDGFGMALGLAASRQEPFLAPHRAWWGCKCYANAMQRLNIRMSFITFSHLTDFGLGCFTLAPTFQRGFRHTVRRYGDSLPRWHQMSRHCATWHNFGHRKPTHQASIWLMKTQSNRSSIVAGRAGRTQISTDPIIFSNQKGPVKLLDPNRWDSWLWHSRDF